MMKLRKFLCLSLIVATVSLGAAVTAYADSTPTIPIAF